MDEQGTFFRLEDVRRATRREHPLALWFGIGIALLCAIALLEPSSIEQSPTSAALPHWTRDLFYAIWGIGGAATAGGIWFAHRPIEASGSILLGSGMAAYTVVILSLSPAALTSTIFVITLAIGCIQRGYYIAKGN